MRSWHRYHSEDAAIGLQPHSCPTDSSPTAVSNQDTNAASTACVLITLCPKDRKRHILRRRPVYSDGTLSDRPETPTATEQYLTHRKLHSGRVIHGCSPLWASVFPRLFLPAEIAPYCCLPGKMWRSLVIPAASVTLPQFQASTSFSPARFEMFRVYEVNINWAPLLSLHMVLVTHPERSVTVLVGGKMRLLGYGNLSV